MKKYNYSKKIFKQGFLRKELNGGSSRKTLKKSLKTFPKMLRLWRKISKDV
jgi:hypothetical protein